MAGVQASAVDFQRVEVTRVVEESVYRAAFEQRFEVLFEEGDEVLAEEQRIAAAGA